MLSTGVDTSSVNISDLQKHLTQSYKSEENEQKLTHLKLTETERRRLCWAQRWTRSFYQYNTEIHFLMNEKSHQISSESQLHLLNSYESEWRSNRDICWILMISLDEKTPILTYVYSKVLEEINISLNYLQKRKTTKAISVRFQMFLQNGNGVACFTDLTSPLEFQISNLISFDFRGNKIVLTPREVLNSWSHKWATIER